MGCKPRNTANIKTLTRTKGQTIRGTPTILTKFILHGGYCWAWENSIISCMAVVGAFFVWKNNQHYVIKVILVLSCILGIVGSSFWSLNQTTKNKDISASAASILIIFIIKCNAKSLEYPVKENAPNNNYILLFCLWTMISNLSYLSQPRLRHSDAVIHRCRQKVYKLIFSLTSSGF